MRKYLKNLQGCLKSSFVSTLHNFFSIYLKKSNCSTVATFKSGYKQASGVIFKTQKVFLYVGKVALGYEGEVRTVTTIINKNKQLLNGEEK